MRRVKEVIVVEGRYDVARLKSAVDATVVETEGFHLFHDKEKMALLRRLAAARGLLILTDSDAAGFVIRNRLSGSLPPDSVKHAYIPEIAGCEKRKTAPSKEGLLGVEGMDNAVVIAALKAAGATFEDEDAPRRERYVTKNDLYDDGLVGQEDSAIRRQRLQQALGLPRRLSANRLLEVLNIAVSPEDYRATLAQLRSQSGETSR
jgi:ribonuclease M5